MCLFNCSVFVRIHIRVFFVAFISDAEAQRIDTCVHVCIHLYVLMHVHKYVSYIRIYVLCIL